MMWWCLLLLLLLLLLVVGVVVVVVVWLLWLLLWLWLWVWVWVWYNNHNSGVALCRMLNARGVLGRADIRSVGRQPGGLCTPLCGLVPHAECERRVVSSRGQVFAC